MFGTPYDVKKVLVTPPGAILDNTSLTTAEIDTLGYSWLEFEVILGATDIALTAYKLTTSDTAGSGHADLSGAVGGTDFTLPTATSDNKVHTIWVNLLGKKRYFDSVITVGDGAAGGYFTAIARLHKGGQQPVSATAASGLGRVVVP